MRLVWAQAFLTLLVMGTAALGQEDKKTDDLKPADPDTGESTVEERTLGLLPNPYRKNGVKFAITHIGEVLGNPTGGAKSALVYEDRFNFAADADLEKPLGLKQLAFHANLFRSTEVVLLIRFRPRPAGRFAMLPCWGFALLRSSDRHLCGQRENAVVAYVAVDAPKDASNPSRGFRRRCRAPVPVIH